MQITNREHMPGFLGKVFKLLLRAAAFRRRGLNRKGLGWQFDSTLSVTPVVVFYLIISPTHTSLISFYPLRFRISPVGGDDNVGPNVCAHHWCERHAVLISHCQAACGLVMFQNGMTQGQLWEKRTIGTQGRHCMKTYVLCEPTS